MTTFYVVARKIHFTIGNVIVEPISFHQTEKEAMSAKDTEAERLRRKFAINGTKDLLAMIGIAGIAFEVGAFETSHEDLVKVPRIIYPH